MSALLSCYNCISRTTEWRRWRISTQRPQDVAGDWVSFWVSTLDTSCVTVLKRDVFTPALPLRRTRLAASAHPGGSARPRLGVSHWPDSAGLAPSRAGGRAAAVEQARAAAQRMKFDSQMAFADTMDAPPVALPLSESQRLQAGHYADCSVRPVEPDGHEVLAEERALQGQDGALTLTGRYASLRPRYQRRSEASNFPALEWKRAFYSNYRRLVIQNHFHKCTKSCFKRMLASANSQCFRVFQVVTQLQSPAAMFLRVVRQCAV